MAEFNKITATMESQVIDFFNTDNCAPEESLSLTGIDGTNSNVAMNTMAFTIAKNAIAISKETVLAIKLAMGTPTTIPADTPMNTLETALGASSLLTDAAATVNAKEQ